MEKNNIEEVTKLVSVGLNAIPVVGGVMSGVANEIIARRQNKRLEEFLLSLSQDIQAVEERLNKDFLKTEDFYDIVEDTFTKVSETRQQVKIDAYKAIFMNSILANSPVIDDILELNDLIYSWQPRHIILLKLLYNPQLVDEQMGNPVGAGGGFSTSLSTILCKLLPQWSEDQIVRTWKDLYDQRIHNTPEVKTMITDRGLDQLQNRLTPFGQHVAKYLTIST